MRRVMLMGFIFLIVAGGCAKRVPPTEQSIGIAEERVPERRVPSPAPVPAPAPEEKRGMTPLPPVREEGIKRESKQPPQARVPKREEGVPPKKEEMVAQLETPKAEAAVPPPEKMFEEALQDIFFDFDKWTIRTDSQGALEKDAKWLSSNNIVRILVEGHCDERGTNEYNMALGERRARATRDFLVTLGVSPDRITVKSFGEERPFCARMNPDEDCHQENRRAHFVVMAR